MPSREEIDTAAIWRALGEGARPIVGWLLTSAGAIALLLGYLGASRELLVARQLPYLASGGLAGIALIFLGAIFIGTQDVRRYGRRLDRLEQMLSDLHEVLLEVDSPQAVVDEPVQYTATQPAAGNGSTATQGTTGSGAPPAETVESSPVNGGSTTGLVTLPKGTTFHRHDCSAVSGKSEIQALAPEEAESSALKPCKLCHPDHAVA